MSFAKELKWRLDAFHDGILAKTTIIDDMDKIAKQYAEDRCRKQREIDADELDPFASFTENEDNILNAPLSTEEK